ncbi:MAG: metallophosphoesterase [Myxococcaceae bacterium]
MNRLSRREALLGGAVTLAAAQSQPAQAQGMTSFRRFIIEEVTLIIPGLLPEHDGVRVAQISDVHVGEATPTLRLLQACNDVRAAKPDVVVMTGDYVTHKRDPLDRVSEILRDFGAPAYAVFGNHDHHTNAPYLRTRFEKNGIAVLQNDNSVLDVRGKPLTLIGVDDGVTKRSDIAKSFKGVQANSSKLVLTHSPSTAIELPPNTGAMVSGHTHGGCIYVPGLTTLLFRMSGWNYVRGQYTVNGNSLYVNRGIGFGATLAFARFNSAPEMTIFTLRAGTRVTPKELPKVPVAPLG